MSEKDIVATLLDNYTISQEQPDGVVEAGSVILLECSIQCSPTRTKATRVIDDIPAIEYEHFLMLCSLGEDCFLCSAELSQAGCWEKILAEGQTHIVN